MHLVWTRMWFFSWCCKSAYAIIYWLHVFLSVCAQSCRAQLWPQWHCMGKAEFYWLFFEWLAVLCGVYMQNIIAVQWNIHVQCGRHIFQGYISIMWIVCMVMLIVTLLIAVHLYEACIYWQTSLISVYELICVYELIGKVWPFTVRSLKLRQLWAWLVLGWVTV